MRDFLLDLVDSVLGMLGMGAVILFMYINEVIKVNSRILMNSLRLEIKFKQLSGSKYVAQGCSCGSGEGMDAGGAFDSPETKLRRHRLRVHLKQSYEASGASAFDAQTRPKTQENTVRISSTDITAKNGPRDPGRRPAAPDAGAPCAWNSGTGIVVVEDDVEAIAQCDGRREGGEEILCGIAYKIE